MTEPVVYIVRRCVARIKVIRSAWWTKAEAESEAERLARDHAAKSEKTVRSKRVRVQSESYGWAVQKFVDRYNGEWYTLSHYEVADVTVQGSAVHRLAELAR